MEKKKVKLIERENPRHVNPNRKYHLLDLETGVECVGNLLYSEIHNLCESANLEIVEN